MELQLDRRFPTEEYFPQLILCHPARRDDYYWMKIQSKNVDNEKILSRHESS